MPHKECNLTKRVQTDKGDRFCPVILHNNGKVKPDTVLVEGKEERHPEGCYYIEWRENGKRKRQSVGRDPVEAGKQRLRKEAELNARNHGLEVAEGMNHGNGGSNGSSEKRLLSAAIVKYLDLTKLTLKPKTYAAYSLTLKYFAESCSKKFLEDVQREDLLRFSAFLRDKKMQSPRSVANKFENVLTFLKTQKIRGIVEKRDWPRYTEEEPEVYENEELETLFGACDEDERLWFEFFLMTGMREQEVMHTYWRDINFNGCTIRVTHKPDRGWTPKAYKEREIPIPAKLVDSLRAHKKHSEKACPLVFPTSGCNPKLDFLDCLKAIAERAGLAQADFWLHKFRATFATRCLWAGVDLRTVQSWMGHSDIESTMRYLKPNRSSEVRNKVNEIFA